MRTANVVVQANDTEVQGEIIGYSLWNPIIGQWQEQTPSFAPGQRAGVKVYALNTASEAQRMKVDYVIAAPDGSEQAVTGAQADVAPGETGTWEYMWLADREGTYTVTLKLYGEKAVVYYLVPWRPYHYAYPEQSWFYISVTAPIAEVTGGPSWTAVRPAPAAEIRERLSQYCPPTDPAFCETVPPRYEVALARIAGLEHLLEYPDTPLECPYCDATFWRYDELQSHIQEAHAPPAVCQFCGEAFLNQDELTDHLISRHIHELLLQYEALFNLPAFADYPCWGLGTDYWQGWLENRINAYTYYGNLAEVDPNLRRIYLALADELERIKVESLCLYAQYLLDQWGSYDSASTAAKAIIDEARAQGCPV